MNASDREQLVVWLEQMIDGRIAAEDLARLQQLLTDEDEARQLYLDLTRQHAQLQWEEARLKSLAATETPKPATTGRSLLASRAALLLALTACAFAAVWIGRWLLPPHATRPVAQLTRVENASWGSNTLPTTLGSELAPGRLQLQLGLATIRFHSGAEVVLQGPAELELRDGMHGTLHSGTAVVEVPEPARGFTLDTPTASVIDYGTMFAVTVDSQRKTATVDVLEGEVEVQHATSKTVQRLHQKQTTVVGEDRLDDVEPSPAEPAVSDIPTRSTVDEGTVRITTATGRGGDATVIQSNVHNHANPHLVFVKNCNDEYRRKGYLAFDLQSLGGQRIESARLVLTLQPSGFGYASLVPDSTFSVYGLMDESLDKWTASNLQWETAPANIDAPGKLDGRLAGKLGQFAVPRGKQTGQVSIEGSALADFLNGDTNGIVTLIVVRDTSDRRPPGLVHAFANHQHPSAAPPTLELRLSDEER